MIAVVIGVIVVALLLVAVQLYRAANIDGKYETQTSKKKVVIKTAQDITQTQDIVMCTVDGVTYTLGSLAMSNSRPMLKNGAEVGKLHTKFISGALSIQFTGLEEDELKEDLPVV